MSLLLLEEHELENRRRIARGPLRPLFDGLVAELRPVLKRDLYVPESKALLSRAGGRCERDGMLLEFDPESPHAQRCTSCQTVHRGDLHHRAWVTSYQLWLAERAVQAALFNVLDPDPAHAAFARDVLRAYATRYLAYPNVDNVLGPTRVFFSTYLESIWLLQICLATDLLEHAGDRATAELVRDRIVEPSRALIAEYDEGMSNRQVWNNAALIAAAALCGDERSFDERLTHASGIDAHLAHAVLADGTWYEGENYHQFALRGLWYSVTMCEARRRSLDVDLLQKFGQAFATPILSALPDFTMPSRKDSQYAVSLRQWRLAELTELGFARTGDALLGVALARCYEEGHERRPTGRARSTADVERNEPSSALTRADLGWRALLHALPELPPLPAGAPRSALLEGQGLAVFRRTDDVYVAVDYGQSGGGHGHPDRLNLILSQGSTRWLDDMGTGSYVDPSLHWYRSTLAHNAPLFDGKSQDLHDGVLLAHEEREGLGWIEARFTADNVSFWRTVIVAPNYLLDELKWSAVRPTRVELPLHVDASADVSLAPAVLDGGRRAEDGYPYVSDVRCANVRAAAPVRLHAKRDGRSLFALLFSEEPFTLFRAKGPGQPAASLRSFYISRVDATEASPSEPRTGTFRTMIAWSDEVQGAQFGESTTIELADGERHVHSRTPDGWHVDLHTGGARSSIDLGGARTQRLTHQDLAPRSPAVLHRAKSMPDWLVGGGPGARSKLMLFELGEDHYRRSEVDWHAAGEPRATIALAAGRRALVVHAVIQAGEARFVPAAALNVFDNEHADTMGAGVQLYLRAPHGIGAWMLVPEPAGGVVRIRTLDGTTLGDAPTAQWRQREGGYEVRVEVALPQLESSEEFPLDVDVIVNETVAGRERRRGQLVMSGARGEFVYLRGDRHPFDRLIPLVILP